MRTIASEETILKVFGRTQQELIALMDRHTLSVQSWLSSRSPQAVTFQGKGIRASSSGFKIPLLNLALGCNFPSTASDKEIEKEIETVKTFFSNRNVPWYLWISALPTPKHIHGILDRHGLAMDHPPLPAMAVSLMKYENYPGFSENIQTWKAGTIDDLKAAGTIRRMAFRFPAGEATHYFEDMASDWLENPSVKLFLAGEDYSEPVAIGALIIAEGVPGIYVMATLPEHHRKGFGKAILKRLMSEAVSGDHQFVVLTASKAGFGLYSQFGFHHIFSFDFYTSVS